MASLDEISSIITSALIWYLMLPLEEQNSGRLVDLHLTNFLSIFFVFSLKDVYALRCLSSDILFGN